MAKNGMAYNAEEIEWIRVHIDDAPWSVLAERFNSLFPRRKRTDKSLQYIASENGLYKAFKYFTKTFRYTDEHYRFLRENRDRRTIEKLTEIFNAEFECNLSSSAIEATLHRLGHHRSDDPVSKLIGSERTVKGVVFIKISNTGNRRKDWVPKHRFIYEQEHGEIGRKDVILFLDGNHTNFSVDNLYKVSVRVASNLKIYGWLFEGQKELQECAIKWCECAEYIKQQFNPDFNMKEWARRERIHELC